MDDLGVFPIFLETPISTNKDTDIHDIMTSITICQSRALDVIAHIIAWLAGWLLADGAGYPGGCFLAKKWRV